MNISNKKWRKWVKPDKEKFLLAGSMLMLASIVIAITDFTKPSVKSEKDLVKIEGKLLYYEFAKGIKGYRNYTLKLQNYTNTFKINANLLKYFEKATFEEEVYNLKALNIYIARRDSNSLNSASNKRVFIFSLSGDNKKYLDERLTIKAHNSRFIIVVAFIFFLSGSILLYFGIKEKKKPSHTREI